MRSSEGICKLIISKTNLINKQNNEATYFIKMADELIRYNRIKHFIFEPKSFLSFSNIKYNLRDDEIILLQSLLTQDYFDDLTPSIQNQFVKNNSYDTVNPIESLPYDNEIKVLVKKSDIQEVLDEIKCNVGEPKLIGGNIKKRKFFPSETTTETKFGNEPPLCTFDIMVNVIYDNNKLNLTKKQLKEELISEYEKYDEYLLSITNILKIQGKKFADQLRVGQITLQGMIMSETYYATNLDIWLLAKRYNIPLIFLSGTKLIENDKPILVANITDKDKYYFIKSPGVNSLKIPKYKLFKINNIAKIPINALSIKMQDMIRSQEDEANIEEYIKSFVDKMKRRPRKKIERIKIIQETIKPKKKKKIIEKLKVVSSENISEIAEDSD